MRAEGEEELVEARLGSQEPTRSTTSLARPLKPSVPLSDCLLHSDQSSLAHHGDADGARTAPRAAVAAQEDDRLRVDAGGPVLRQAPTRRALSVHGHPSS